MCKIFMECKKSLCHKYNVFLCYGLLLYLLTLNKKVAWVRLLKQTFNHNFFFTSKQRFFLNKFILNWIYEFYLSKYDKCKLQMFF